MKQIYYVMLAMFFATFACNKIDDQVAPPPANQVQSNHFYGSMVAEKGIETRGVAQKTNLWYPCATIKVKLLNDPYNMAEKIKTYAAEWQKYAGITFEFVTTGDAEVRIGFDWNDERYITWSYIGTDCKMVSNQNEATMSFAYWDFSTEEERKGDVLRAFGQVLGLELEHRHLSSEIVFRNIEKYWKGVMEDVSWDNLQKYVYTPLNASNIIATEDWDKNSIMIWPFPRGTADVRGPNYELSEQDKLFIAKLYPRCEDKEWMTKVDHFNYLHGVEINEKVYLNTCFEIYSMDKNEKVKQEFVLRNILGNWVQSTHFLGVFDGCAYYEFTPVISEQYRTSVYYIDKQGQLKPTNFINRSKTYGSEPIIEFGERMYYHHCGYPQEGILYIDKKDGNNGVFNKLSLPAGINPLVMLSNKKGVYIYCYNSNKTENVILFSNGISEFTEILIDKPSRGINKDKEDRIYIRSHQSIYYLNDINELELVSTSSGNYQYHLGLDGTYLYDYDDKHYIGATGNWEHFTYNATLPGYTSVTRNLYTTSKGTFSYVQYRTIENQETKEGWIYYSKKGEPTKFSVIHKGLLDNTYLQDAFDFNSSTYLLRRDGIYKFTE